MKYFDMVKTIPVLENAYDVLVAGAGPAGICAAVTAKREGARVALIERYGILGGNLTVGHVGPILGMVGKGTMRDELLKLLGVPDNDMIGETGLVHDIEKAKQILADFVAAEEIDVFLQTPVADVIMEGKSLKGLILASKEGLSAVYGKITVDATGDGDIAFFAGAPFEIGRKSDGLMQPVTLEFTINGVDESCGIACIGDVDDVKLNGERFLDFTARCAREGLLPEVMSAVRLHRTTVPGERRVNTTQANGVNALYNQQLFPAELTLRRQMDILMNFLRNNLPGYENCKLVNSASTLGVRETRRISGEYVLSTDDMSIGRRYNDTVVHNADFVIDIHNPTGSGQAEESIQKVKPYDIPYRCLVPLGVENLILSGRCISGTHRAHASYRVMSICMAIGQAAGTAASVSIREATLPRKTPAAKIQEALKRQGVELFD